MEPIIVQLVSLNQRFGRMLGGVFGALIGVIIAGTRFIESEGRRWRDRLHRLEKRVDVLEAATPASTAATLTTGEAQLLTSSNLTGAVSNLTAALFTYTSNDIQRPFYHQLRLTAGGAVATGTIVSMRWATPFAATRAPKVTMSYQNNTSAGAAKLTGLIPTFNSVYQNTGYDVDSPIALASGDVQDMGISFREISS